MSDTASITLSMDAGPRQRPGEPTLQPQLVVLLECSRPLGLSARHSLADIHTVRLGRGTDRRSQRGDGELLLRIPDRWMSSVHARIEYSFGRWVLEDTDSKNGSIVNGEPTRRAVLRDGDLFELGHTLFLFNAAVPTDERQAADVDLSELAPPAFGLHTLATDLAAQFAKLEQVARSPIPILIQGASGTGKEVIARAAHTLSGRKGEFIAVNCGAIPANLVESELFGYRKGAFSGALEDRPGLVRSADGGTLFLDEIGDLPPASQAALLRVLQEREVMPVGGVAPVKVDLRVVAATHRDIDDLVACEVFRRDLFARLAGFRLIAPTLCERRVDLGLLLGTLLARVTADPAAHPGFDVDTVRLMYRHAWPLNIRELEQCVQTASVLAGNEAIAPDHLPESVRSPQPKPAPAPAASPALNPEDTQLRAELVAQLGEHRGNISAISRAMGKDRKQIQRWMKRFQLDAARFR